MNGLSNFRSSLPNVSHVHVRNAALVAPNAGRRVSLGIAPGIDARLDHICASSVTPTHGKHLAGSDAEAIWVRAATLDRELRTFRGQIDILSIFTGGVELEVLRGAVG